MWSDLASPGCLLLRDWLCTEAIGGSVQEDTHLGLYSESSEKDGLTGKDLQ